MWRLGSLLALLVLSSCITAKGSQERQGDELKAFSNVCTNGKVASKLTLKQYMTEFAAGPCSPLVLTPGIMGSILYVEIDCAKLKASDPQTFSYCGWSSCPGEFGHTLESSPNEEYQIWVPDPFAPMTILYPTERSKLCFGGLIEVVYDKSSGKPVPTNKPGVKVSPKGFTKKSSGYAGSECGTTSIKDLVRLLVDPEGTQYYRFIIDRLKDMGYLSGLTLQALPYDFRLHSGADNISKNIGKILKRLSAFNNKKVVIVAHSMGCTKSLYGLWNMNQADKDASVALFLALAPPFIGSEKPLDYLTCGASDFDVFNFGLDFKSFKLSAGSFPSMLELAPSLIYSKAANEPWMKQIKARISYESNQSNDPVFNWLPTREQVCYPNFKDKFCRSGLQDYGNFGTYLKDFKITADTYRKWLNDHTYSKDTSIVWPIIDTRFDTMPNPGVPTVVVYSQVLDTPGIFSFNVDPKPLSDANKFCSTKDRTFVPIRGDTTVPSTSAITPAIKWAYEYLNKAANSKPVKIVDICSEFNVKTEPYDSMTKDGRKAMSKVEYQGLPCDCSEGKDRHCDHASLLHLQQLADYIGNTLITNDKTSMSAEVAAMTEAQLNAFQQTCQIQLLLTSVKEENSSIEAEMKTADN